MFNTTKFKSTNIIQTKTKQIMIRHDDINGRNEVHDVIYGKFTLDQVVYLNKAPFENKTANSLDTHQTEAVHCNHYIQLTQVLYLTKF